MSANSGTRLCSAMASLAMLAISAAPAVAQALSFAPLFPFEPAMPRYAPQEQSEDVGSEQLPAQLRRQVVPYQTTEAAGTIIIDTSHTFLYLTLGHGMAMRYGIGVGRQGFTWSGVETIVRKSEWPDWRFRRPKWWRGNRICRVGSAAGPAILWGRVRFISVIPHIASTALTIRPASANTFPAAASGCRTPTSSICTAGLE